MLREFWMEEDGAAVVDMILLLSALVAVALIFRKQLIAFVTTMLEKIFGSAEAEASPNASPN